MIKRDIIICHDVGSSATVRLDSSRSGRRRPYGLAFSRRRALNQNERLVAIAYVERLRAHRLTLTLPVINAAAQVTFLIAGQSKRAIVDAILRSDSDSFNYPAARVSPTDGQLTWLITADAMENLPIR